MLGYMTLGNEFSGGIAGQARAQARANATGLYQQACNRALWGRICSLVTRRSRSLLSLNGATEGRSIRSRSYGGTRTVPMSQIRGSEGRCNDFDQDFRPLQGHTRERWIGIAAARELGVSMPPVELVQVGDAYFVRDGHHRISVARARGQRDIEAEVTVWHLGRPDSDGRPAGREDKARAMGGMALTPAGA